MKPNKPAVTPIDKELARVHEELENWDPEDKEYETVLNRLQTLYELKCSTQTPARKPLSSDAILQTATYVFGMVAVLSYEHAFPITSKAFSLIPRLIR